MSALINLPYGGEAESSHDFLTNSVTDPAIGSGGPPGAATFLSVPPTNYATTPKWPEAPVLWTHYWMEQQGLPFNPTTNDNHLDWLNGSGAVVARILVSGETSFTFNFYTLQGGVLTFVDSVTLGTFSAGWFQFDVGITAGAGGSITLVVGGSLIWSHGGLNHSDFNGIAQVRHRALGDNFGASATCGWCQMFYAPYSTVGTVLYHFIPNTNSAVNTQWVGNVSNVNPVPTNDSQPLITPSPSQISTFYNNTQSVSGNILGVLGTSRMLVSAGGPPNIKIAQRVGGGNYFSPPIVAGPAYQACGYFWNQNPATLSPYTSAQIPTLEMGVESST